MNTKRRHIKRRHTRYNMCENIAKIAYINLDERPDRKEEIEKELESYGLVPNERFKGIKFEYPRGIVGCGYAHLNVLKEAREKRYKNILIFEDDFEFLVSKEAFDKLMRRVFDDKVEFDVIMLAYNLQVYEESDYDYLYKVNKAHTASGYLVNESMYDELIELYEWAIPKLDETLEHWIYANDQIWVSLMCRKNWYCFKERVGRQRASHSDNTNTFADYGI